MGEMELQKVLIVEDDLDITLIVEMALRDIAKLEVQSVVNGQQALDRLQEWKPDLVLMDIMMPVLSGPKAAEKMQQSEETRDIPVVFMTAKSESDDTEGYKKHGVLEVLIKPLDPLQLAQHLNDLYRAHRESNQ